MTRLLQSTMVAAILLLSGCSFIDGVVVTVHRESGGAFKEQMEVFLRSKGFHADGHQDESGFVLAVQPRINPNPRKGLYAVLYPDGDSFRFFIGKGNCRSFSEEERAVVGDCIAFLIERAQMIQSGSASKASSGERARAAFYANIQEA